MSYVADPRVAEHAIKMLSAQAARDSHNPKSYISEFSHFLDKLGRRLHPEREMFALDIHEIEQYATVFLSMKNWDELPFIDVSITLQLLIHMGRADNTDLYNSLTPGAQKFLLSASRNINGWTPDVYLRTLSRIGSHLVLPIKHNNYKTYRVDQRYIVKRSVDRALEEIREHARNPAILDRLDLTPPSIEFVDAIRARSAGRLLMTHDHACELLFFWKVLYGENVVIEMLETFDASHLRLDQHDLMNLMEDWDHWRQYPAEWIYETYSISAAR